MLKRHIGRVVDLKPLSQYRARKAQEIYSELQDMTEATYIADTILAYLQSPSFFALILILLFYRLVRMYVQRFK